MKKRIKRLQGSSYVISLEPADELGQGSFGKVVRAYDIENQDELLCAKIMDIGTQTKLETLNHELQQSLKSCEIQVCFYSQNNSQILRRYTLRSQKACYIIMEYCNGGTLEEKMKGKLLSEIEIYDFLSQFCSGYRELYQQGIIHRGNDSNYEDLKPANIMIHDRIYKITDFGLAKVVNNLNEDCSLSFKGTPLYMAPEMIKEEAQADAKIDMWSFGIILYRLLFNKFPFLLPNKKYDRDKAFKDILDNPLVIPKNHKRSEELIQLVFKMLEKDPRKRISWDQLFDLQQIRLQGQGQDQNIMQSKMSSSIFIQSMITQKVSLIKVQVFKDRVKPPTIEKIINHDQLQQKVKKQDDQQIFIINDMVSKLKTKLETDKSIKQIEDRLLFVKEQIVLLDMAALRIYRLKQYGFDQHLLANLVFSLLTKAIFKLDQLKNLDQLTKQEYEIYKNTPNCQLLMQILEQDYQSLVDFKKDVEKFNTPFKNPIQQLLQDIQKRDIVNKQIVIAVRYLKDCQDVDEMSIPFTQFEDFWRYQEEVEMISEEESSAIFRQLIA